MALVYGKGQNGLPSDSQTVESACQCRRHGFDPWVGKTPWRRKWQPTPVFLSGRSHGQRSLLSCSPWGHKRVGHDLATEEGKWQPSPVFCLGEPMDRGVWWATVHGVTRVGHKLTTKWQQQPSLGWTFGKQKLYFFPLHSVIVWHSAWYYVWWTSLVVQWLRL